MNEHITPGVVLAQICDESFLIATGPAHGRVPFIKALNATGAFFFHLMEQGLSREEILRAAEETYHTDRETIRPALMSFIDSLRQAGYLTEELS